MSEEGHGEGIMNLPADFKHHASIFSAKSDSFCWKKNESNPPVLRNKVIAAREFTDMLLLEWPDAMTNNHEAVYSLGRALALAGAKLL